jgi:predicted lipid-binding transport protein (Tim44 family)
MTDTKAADRPASTSSAFSPFWSGLMAGIVGGLLVGTLMNVWSSYLTRLDQHVQ